jgi:hypothetical protein
MCHDHYWRWHHGESVDVDNPFDDRFDRSLDYVCHCPSPVVLVAAYGLVECGRCHRLIVGL